MSAAIETVVNWSEMLNELRRMGIRTGQISMRVHLSSGNIREYRLGIKAPMHSNGERIIEYWIKLTGKTRADLPMMERVS